MTSYSLYAHSSNYSDSTVNGHDAGKSRNCEQGVWPCNVTDSKIGVNCQRIVVPDYPLVARSFPTHLSEHRMLNPILLTSLDFHYVEGRWVTDSSR